MTRETELPAAAQNRLWTAVLGLSLLLLLAACAGIPGGMAAAPDDATVYWEAGLRMRKGGDDLYDRPGLENRVGRYIYPPAFAALFAPLTFVDGRPPATAAQRLIERPYRYPAGVQIWVWLHLPMLALVFWLLGPVCGIPAAQRLRAAALAALATLAACYIDIDWGNVNILVLALVVAGLALVEKERPLPGGALIGAAAAIKVLPCVLLLVFVAQGRTRAVWGMLLGAALLLLLPLIWLVPHFGFIDGVAQNAALHAQWVGIVALPGAQGSLEFAGGTASPNISISAWLGRLFTEGAQLTAFERPGVRGALLFALDDSVPLWVSRILTVGMLGCSLWLALVRGANAASRTLAASLALVAVHLGNPLCWPYHLVLLALPVAALVSLRPKRGFALAGLLAGTVTLPLLLYRVPGYSFFEQAIVWGLPTAGLLAAFGLCALALFRAKPEAP